MKNLTWGLVGFVTLLLLWGFLGAIVMQGNRPPIEIVESVDVPVLIQPVEANRVITAADHVSRRFPRKALPTDVILDTQKLDNKLALTHIEANTPITTTQVSDYLAIPVLNTAVAPGTILSDSLLISNLPLSTVMSNTVTSTSELTGRMALVALAPYAPITREQISDVRTVPVPKRFILAGETVTGQDFEIKPVRVSLILTDTLVSESAIQSHEWQALESLPPSLPIRKPQLVLIQNEPTPSPTAPPIPELSHASFYLPIEKIKSNWKTLPTDQNIKIVLVHLLPNTTPTPDTHGGEIFAGKFKHAWGSNDELLAPPYNNAARLEIALDWTIGESEVARFAALLQDADAIYLLPTAMP